ncbi:WD40-repeat-containing domain protein [Neohortaea acidophila]|uniref:WD40-repeat-containing domain protein n=1 Tax=Neohortaea acidophila TaxID=245834 RepID=A0A6A6Q1B8_9PEZI|nr:WD40-repeat-containing domain protein [Neohortaea acidophila]KAF2486082.1 WD40-repeat-containing domain protein [Neohortaea acidophila]
MAEPPFFSSQGSEYERHQIIEEVENIQFPSLKPKKPPTVTPKRFKKFFTPRASLSARNARQSKAGRQLRDITKNGANLRRHTPPTDRLAFADTQHTSFRAHKRQKCSVDLSSSPAQSSPLKRMQTAEQFAVYADPPSPLLSDDEDVLDLADELQIFAKPIRRLRQSGHGQRLLQRSFGYDDAALQRPKGYAHCADWRSETTRFVSTPGDIHRYGGAPLPFCVANCNTNSLVAIGDEEGGVRLIDSAPSSDFSRAHVSFRPHHNAVMDIAFSSDDYLLATASGDQTSRIIDMHTQHAVCILSGHKSSVKQVRFQPNDDNILTTSSRDGSVLLWDMRCGGRGSVASLRTAFARNVDNGGLEPSVRYSKYSLDAASAHRSLKRAPSRASGSDQTEAGGVSITAIQHLGNGREHLLLTTSEVDSSIKLWDLRNVGRRSSNALAASTPVPVNHVRNYGISAMALSGDGARLYTVCRDSIVYAYSTNHLALGNAPHTSTTNNNKARMAAPTTSGLGPLYGFKHPALRVGTFYVKAAIRQARGDKSEVLAVGSSDGHAVLFPTDEQYLPKRLPSINDTDEDDEAALPSFPTAKSKAEFPIHQHGTALVRGHGQEVTSIAWSHDGELVTIGDDFKARCWRENDEKARHLRGCGEGQGLRWGCGWADVDSAWDEDDG